MGEKAYEKLVEDAHNNTASSIKHVGCRKTFEALNKRYFTFGGRYIVRKVVAKCAICALNNHQRGAPTKTGNQLTLEPNDAGAIDICGPIRGFGQTAQGNARYIVVFVDMFSRLTIAHVASSTSDAEVLRALERVRSRLCGLPRKIYCDNALCNDGSASASYLKSHGVKIIHGMTYVSRCQSKVERTINTLTRLVCKYHTQEPHSPFVKLVEEAELTINSTPSDGLGGWMAPKDVHFARPPANLLPPLRENRDGNELLSARLRSQQVVLQEVKRCLKQTPITSPTDYTNRYKVGQLALRKRMVFPSNCPKKLSYKTLFKPLKITHKVASNAYRCVDIATGEEMICPGDLLIKVSVLTEDELRALCKEMEETVRRNETGSRAFNAAPREEERPVVRRSRRLQGRMPEVEEAELNDLFNA